MKICYISLNTNNPRDQITLMGLKENGIHIIEINENSPGLRKFKSLKTKHLPYTNTYDFLMIGYTSAILVPIARMISKKKVIYNSLCSFIDSMVISRYGGSKFSFSALYYYVLDFIAFHSANMVFVESVTQKKFIEKLFFLNPHKVKVHYVGVNDKEFFFDASVKKLDKFTALFRGKFLPEAGVDVVIRAAKELEDENINFRIIGHGLLEKEVNKLMNELRPANVDMIMERISMDSLRNKMLECHVSIGQVADHPRVETTIPHKAFESMSMKLAYITGRNKGILEIFDENKTCMCSIPGDHKDLANKILELRNNQAKVSDLSEKAFAKYNEEYTPKILAEKMIVDLNVLK